MAGVPNINDAADLDVEDGETSDAWIMFAQSLHVQGSEDDVRETFSKFGPITKLLVKLEHCTGFLRSYVWFEFSSFEQVRAAVRAYNAAKIPDHWNLDRWMENSEYVQCMPDYSYVKIILNVN